MNSPNFVRASSRSDLSAGLPRLVMGSRLVGSDLRAWHRFWRDYGGTGNYRSLSTPLVRSKPESLGATLSNPCRDIQIRMVGGFSEIGHRNRVSVDRKADCPDLTCMDRTDLLEPSFRRSCLRGFCESNLPLLSEHGPPSSHSDPLRLATLTRNHHMTRHSVFCAAYPA